MSLVRGTPDKRRGQVLRTTLMVRVVLIIAALAALGLMLGGEPWGPR